LFCILLLGPLSLCQLLPSGCDSIKSTPQECNISEQLLAFEDQTIGAYPTFESNLTNQIEVDRDARQMLILRNRNYLRPSLIVLSPVQSKSRFHLRKALIESFTFFAMEQAYLVHDEYHWITLENGVPFNHYWSNYRHSLSTWADSGWSDGDPFLDNYIGHPIQGALTGYIQIQNDPQGERLEFSNSKAYWRSRMKAMFWSAAYSTQWEIGPLSELTIERYGSVSRGKWNPDGTYPCVSRNCVTGTGKVDVVITPLGGLGWMIAEDVLDKQVARRVEGATRNRFVIATTRCAVNPIRGAANILHGKLPWFRASRDSEQVYWSRRVEVGK
jgi:hypothetical protein